MSPYAERPRAVRVPLRIENSCLSEDNKTLKRSNVENSRNREICSPLSKCALARRNGRCDNGWIRGDRFCNAELTHKGFDSVCAELSQSGWVILKCTNLLRRTNGGLLTSPLLQNDPASVYELPNRG